MILSARWLILVTHLSNVLITSLKKYASLVFSVELMSYHSHTKGLLNGREVAADHTEVVGIINRNKAGYGISTTHIAPV